MESLIFLAKTYVIFYLTSTEMLRAGKVCKIPESLNRNYHFKEKKTLKAKIKDSRDTYI